MKVNFWSKWDWNVCTSSDRISTRRSWSSPKQFLIFSIKSTSLRRRFPVKTVCIRWVVLHWHYQMMLVAKFIQGRVEEVIVRNCQSWIGRKGILWITSSFVIKLKEFWPDFYLISTSTYPFDQKLPDFVVQFGWTSFQGLEFEYINQWTRFRHNFDIDFRRRNESTRFWCLKLIKRSIDLVDIEKIVGNLVDQIFSCFTAIRTILFGKSFKTDFIISLYKIDVLTIAKIYAHNENVISCLIATHLIPTTL